ncbi:MAG TPA: hypothetical protein VMK83_04150 [Gaiellaceae bacterium]|nr:hypothetical protein [Gaiellaceae bacterium]
MSSSSERSLRGGCGKEQDEKHFGEIEIAMLYIGEARERAQRAPQGEEIRRLLRGSRRPEAACRHRAC